MSDERDGALDGGFDDDEDLDPEAAEQAIREFIASADDLDGPAVDVIAAAVMDLVDGAWNAIATVLEGVAHNKVLAAQLFLGQRARERDGSDDVQWQLHAASTLLSGFVVRG
ncbi:MAG TPA: hypothetical protein VFZ83_13085 [Acidimicrobiia bacterium]|nr:hypothetical protein [Acidimicrobiia bacterium]